MSAQTRTVEQVEASLETVEIEEAQCPVCQQWYAEDDILVPIAVGARYEDDVELVTADEVTQVCTGCAEGLFDYQEVPDGRLEAVRRELRWWTPREVGEAAGWISARVLPFVIAGGALWLTVNLMQKVVETSTAAFEVAAGVGSAGSPIIPIILTGIVIHIVFVFGRGM